MRLRSPAFTLSFTFRRMKITPDGASGPAASSTFMNPIIRSSVTFDLNIALRRSQSAHSFAIARWVSSLRSLTSNSVPQMPRSRERRGM